MGARIYLGSNMETAGKVKEPLVYSFIRYTAIPVKATPRRTAAAMSYDYTLLTSFYIYNVWSTS